MRVLCYSRRPSFSLRGHPGRRHIYGRAVRFALSANNSSCVCQGATTSACIPCDASSTIKRGSSVLSASWAGSSLLTVFGISCDSSYSVRCLRPSFLPSRLELCLSPCRQSSLRDGLLYTLSLL